MYVVLKTVGVVWTLPNTLFGFLLGITGLLFGGKMRFVRGAFEFHGAAVRWMLGRLPNQIRAITLGHSILGIDQRSLDLARDHEHVHVAQYERWGPFFIPAYLLASLYLKLGGKDPYYDNPFEKKAYAIADPDFTQVNPGDNQPDTLENL